ncbi:MAG: ABC transporter substrate-binding protein, partial [Promicromonosporaceae bacterium]|nr:ABC transporter substrate-binding protein [Promicromonosporaceae bacterium]
MDTAPHRVGRSAAARGRFGGVFATTMALGLLLGACGGGSGTAGDAAVVGPDGTTTPVAVPGTDEVAASVEYAPGTNIPLPLEAVEITWMHNGDTDPLRSYWNQVAQEFMAQHPGVVVNVTAVETDQLRYSVLPSAFQADVEPDLFQSWGGGELTSWINEGVVMDLTQVLAPTIAQVGSVESIWELGGQAYGIPYAVGPAGFWVNLNLLNEAGLVQNPEHDAAGNVTGGTVDWPTDFDGLFAMWSTLKDHGITPVAVGGGSGWAAAWWYYAMVAKACPASAITAAGSLHDFSDPCWEQAATDLQGVLNQNAFNSGWETTLAQGSAEASAGLVVMGDAAMELMGPWNGTTMSNIYRTAGGGTGATPDFITWYPVPNLAGGQGAGNIMVGGDGFSVLNPSRGSEARSNAAA